MPSRLITSTANFGQGLRLRQTAKTVAAALQKFGTLEIRGPFLGFQPDVDPNLTDGTSFDRLQNVLARAHGEDHGEVLGLPDGFRQIDPDRLPLGDTSPPARGVDLADPVVRLDQLVRVTPAGAAGDFGDFSVQWQVTPMVVTAGDGTTNLSGNMYRLNAAGNWTHVPESLATTDARALKAGRDGRASSPSLPDSCVAPFGATARADTSAAANDDGQSGAIGEPCWIFTNDTDEVMVFPSSTVETIAGTHTYEPLTNVAALDSGGANGFKAKSVETWNGRVYFLNTSEAGTRRSRRLRRTAKFTADPDPAIVGAGFFDFTEFQGEGLRVETLGDVLAVYFSDGVAFLRPTGNPTSPDEPQIISSERGLLGTHCVTAIGRNVHFCICTDGWWLLDQSGRWQEIGIANVNGKLIPKWRQTFYENIPANVRHRVYTYYDQPNNLVYITWPTESVPSPGTVWIYDPTSDRVFIENYDVTVFGTFTPPTQAGVVIDSVTEIIDTVTETIDSFAPIPGFPKVRVHGDTAGFVYQHKREFNGFHGPEPVTSPVEPTVQDPEWIAATGLRSPSGFRNLSCVDRVSLEYFDHGNTSNVSVEVSGPNGSQTENVVLTSGTPDEGLRYRDAWFRFSDIAVSAQISGAGEFHIRSLAADLWTDPHEPRGL